MPNVSIRLRLVLSLLLIIGSGGIIQAASHFQQSSDTAALEARSALLLDLRSRAYGPEGVAGAQHDAIAAYLVTADPAYVTDYEAARIREAQLVGAATTVMAGRPDLSAVLAALQDVARATEAWRDVFVAPTIELMRSGREAAARLPQRVAAGDALYRIAIDAAQAYDARVGELDAANLADMRRIEENQYAMFLVGLVGSLAGLLTAIGLLSRWILRPIRVLLVTAKRAETGEDVAFPVDREDELGRLGQALETMRSRLFGQASEASTINRFTELTAFVEADGDVARATLDALSEIVEPGDGAIHISNRSRDRAVPEGSIGSVTPGIIALGQLALCPGVRRSSLYVSADLAERLGVRCPVYPSAAGTLACIPLIALGEVVGAVHLHWDATDALPLGVRSAVTRITEHASLAIANRRLMTALQGMASTDSRTGLPNSRSLDEALQDRLANRDHGDPVSVLMLDIDHFKAFNDRNGHPAGDEALRTFARILEGAVRDVDIASRYGGEEFVVMLPGASTTEATAVAERIRARTAETVIELSPGHRDQITVSIGVATWPSDATDRVRLLEVADAALYRAKNAGRDRVVVASEAFEPRARDAGGDPGDAAAAGDPDHDRPALSLAG